MIRAIFGVVFILPLVLIGLVVRYIASSQAGQVIALLLFVVACCSACGVTTYALERDARQCQAEAWTVEAMTECSRLYPQHNGTISDRLSQPLGELERKLF